MLPNDSNEQKQQDGFFPGECARGVAEYMAECRKYGSITKCGLELAWSFRVHLLGMQDVDALNGK